MSELKPVKLGFCILCSERVFKSEDYLKSTDGYCHRECIPTKQSAEARTAL